MNRLCRLIGLLLIGFSAGCHSDIVCTKHLKSLTHKCVHIEPIESENPYVGQVLRDVLEKEFIRRRFEMCDANTATVLIHGSTFMTVRASADAGGLGSHKSSAANQAIESVTVTARNAAGQTLLTASYDNCEQYTASKLAKEFGAALVEKFR